MALFFYTMLFLIFILLFKLFKNENIIITFLCSILIIYIIIAPRFCIEATLSGAKLFFYKVFPSLFPFLILTNIIINYGGVHIYSKLFGKILCAPLKLKKECSFPLIVSALCGYPLGAKYSCDLYENGDINFSTLERLINIASNAGPLFIIGSVGTSMLGNPYAGYVLLLSNYISCIIVGLIVPSRNTKMYRDFKKNFKISNKNIGESLKNSIDGAIKTCIGVAGFVILFSLLLNILKNNFLFKFLLNKLCIFFNIDKNLIEGFLLGLVEMTNGCYLISTSSIDISKKLILISFLLAFSGFSIISQVYSFTYKQGINIKRYIKIKFIQGLIASTTCVILYKIPIFSMYLDTFTDKNTHLILSNNLLFIFILLLLIVPLIIYYIKFLNKN
ncbi:sporulation integral membrane protein YlbJ [Clostridium sporogenes]|uniref:sporulation integral membrane protein YlbJ n=1 Tax=Clostridium sporogenes TaxID=1509 RepID=UPI00214A132A|nr:sporulation integral membrane protein YlbJ [Clostridium sporogenes]MCR1974848.1 sporulation integral membrane protein YlbJ [Clostridium sporogenes]